MSGGPQSSGVSFFCFHALVDTKQKKLTPLDRGPPLHVNRVLEGVVVNKIERMPQTQVGQLMFIT